MRFFSTMILLFIVLTNVAFTANPAIIWGSGGYAENLAPTGIKFKSGVLLDDNGTGLSTDQDFSALGSVGVGVASPNEKLTVEGVTSLRETTAPTLTANYGKMFVKATDSLPYFLDDSGVEHSMSDALARLGASTYSTFQDLQNTMHSTGIISGNGITDAGAGAVDVGAGTGLIRATNSDTAELLFFDWSAAAGLTLTDGQVNYIYVEYNAGTPQIVADTTKRTDYNTNLLLGVVSRDGTIVHISDADEIRVGNHSSLMNRRMLDTDPFKSVKDDRPLLGETGTRNISVEAATFWEGLTKFSTAAFDSSVASQFQGYFYRDGLGGWTRIAAQTQIDNLQYDDGTGVLATLTATRYGVHWIYLEQDGDVSVIYGQGDYFLADALDALPPSTIPSQLQVHGRLIGRVILQKSAATFTLIESISDVTDFQSFVPTEHSSLLGLISGDDHTQYALLAGRAGGQTLIGGTAAGEDLTLQSTSNATRGSILFGTSEYDEVNNRLGVNTTAPSVSLEVSGLISQIGTGASLLIGNGAGSGDDFTANNNVALGENALNSNITGANNVAVGFQAGNGAGGSHDQNTFIGSLAGDSVTTGSANILLGYNIDLPTATTSNYMSLGDAITADLTTDIVTFPGTGALVLNNGTDAQRPGTPAAGMIRFNTTTNEVERYDGTGWASLENTPSFTTVTKTASTTLLTSGEDNVVCDTTSAAVTLTLPTAVGNNGLTYKITNKVATNICTIDGSGTETIGGELTVRMGTVNDSIIIASDGTNWYYLNDDVSYYAKYSTNDSTTNNVANNTTTKIVYEDLDSDALSLCDGAGTCTAPVDGIYHVHCEIRPNALNVVAGELQAMYMYVNAVAARNSVIEFNGTNATNTTTMATVDTVPLLSGDTVDCRYFQNSGGSVPVNPANDENVMIFTRIR